MVEEMVIISVWPSSGALFSACAAMPPPAPTRFSTTTVWPLFCEMYSP